MKSFALKVFRLTRPRLIGVMLPTVGFSYFTLSPKKKN
jgi:hypothetical protein